MTVPRFFGAMQTGTGVGWREGFLNCWPAHVRKTATGIGYAVAPAGSPKFGRTIAFPRGIPVWGVGHVGMNHCVCTGVWRVSVDREAMYACMSRVHEVPIMYQSMCVSYVCLCRFRRPNERCTSGSRQRCMVRPGVCVAASHARSLEHNWSSRHFQSLRCVGTATSHWSQGTVLRVWVKSCTECDSCTSHMAAVDADGRSGIAPNGSSAGNDATQCG